MKVFLSLIEASTDICSFLNNWNLSFFRSANQRTSKDDQKKEKRKQINEGTTKFFFFWKNKYQNSFFFNFMANSLVFQLWLSIGCWAILIGGQCLNDCSGRKQGRCDE